MRVKRQLDLTNHKIWKDKNINPETKEIYFYLYVEGFDRDITNINIGRVQTEFKSIKNLAFAIIKIKYFREHLFVDTLKLID